ncbi:unnamed protein product [Diabrotica balteata]|uniref:Uncharacterized protein n=1 Tax=Diabrotica balteata TaxID=107213 RepID=A0A9N9XCV2_DIABA|nr:unnamed protein product [Diabrotica balteata]
MLPVLVSNFPAGASAQMAYHIAQISHSDNFTRYDYGTEKNMKIYGQPNAPEFNLSAVTTPVALYYAKNDFLAAYEASILFIDLLL